LLIVRLTQEREKRETDKQEERQRKKRERERERERVTRREIERRERKRKREREKKREREREREIKEKERRERLRMAPGGFSILAPFLGRKTKKYEKLETDDPEKRKQEATQEEIQRLNCKIVSDLHFTLKFTCSDSSNAL
jgi:hypothetical protein